MHSCLIVASCLLKCVYTIGFYTLHHNLIRNLVPSKNSSTVVCLGEASKALALGPPLSGATRGVLRVHFPQYW